MKSYEILQKLPLVKEAPHFLLIFDSVLLKNPLLKKWIHRFPMRYSVKSGEQLKDLDALPLHLKKILEIQKNQQVAIEKIYVLGGGSVGDFGGFVASILKRGVPVIQIPSTWLAALDSAHGGKTALNIQGFKNQIGTFHYPEKVLIIREVLETQPPIRLKEAAGEFLKTALLGGPRLFTLLSHWDWVLGKVNWNDLKTFIEVKYAVLKKDPFEKKGLRHVLNLGHTLGHVFESSKSMPHGMAIYYGLLFDMAWSTKLGLLSPQTAQKIMSLDPWESLFDIKADQKLFNLDEKKLRQYLLQDKKNSAQGLRYIFIQKPGQVVIKVVKIQDIIKEFKRQKKILENFYEEL